jgi:hypothetical protein
MRDKFADQVSLQNSEGTLRRVDVEGLPDRASLRFIPTTTTEVLMSTRAMSSILATVLSLALGCPAEKGADNAPAASTEPATTTTKAPDAPSSQPAEPRAATYTVDLPPAGALKPATEGDAKDVREKLAGSWISTTEGPNGLVISQTLTFVGDGAFTEVNAAGDQRREQKGTYTVVAGDENAFTLQLKTATAMGGSRIVYSLRDDGTLVAQGGGREFFYTRVQVQ